MQSPTKQHARGLTNAIRYSGSAVLHRLGIGVRPSTQATIAVGDISLTAVDTLYTTYDLKTQQVIDQRQLPSVLRTASGEV